jgi:signal peptide peptidase SppA
MRFQQVFHKVYGEPWQILKPDWYGIHELVLKHWADFPSMPANNVRDDVEVVPTAQRPKTGFWGDVFDQFRVEKGVAIVPIKGSIVKGAGMFEKSCGAVSHEDIHGDIDQVIAGARAGQVHTAVFDFNSPGGMVMGTPEVSARIAGLRHQGVRTMAFTDELMASAAYEMAAGVQEIFATPSAIVGSIGTIWEFYNVAKQLAARGVEYNVFTSGPYKGMGHPAVALTDDQKAWIQEHVDMHANAFKAHVRLYRKGVAEETMQGQSFTGEQGKAAGLVDNLVGSFRDVLQMASQR